MLREDFLHQSAYHPIDRYCPPEKAYWMLRNIMSFYQFTRAALEKGVSLKDVTDLPVVSAIARMKELPVNQAVQALQGLMERIQSDFATLGVNGHAANSSHT